MSRAGRIAGGSTLIIAGTAMLVLPGPGLLTIAAGVALLSKDIQWAERLRAKLAPRKAGSQADAGNT
jgi:hypothetical protein